MTYRGNAYTATTCPLHEGLPRSLQHEQEDSHRTRHPATASGVRMRMFLSLHVVFPTWLSGRKPSQCLISDSSTQDHTAS